MPQTLEDEITKEIQELIARAKAQDAEYWYIAVFNNLNANFPGGYRRNMPKDILEKKCKDLGKSTLEFFEEIDQIIQEKGLNPEEIKRLNKEMKYAEVYELILPAYIELRRRGYENEVLQS